LAPELIQEGVKIRSSDSLITVKETHVAAVLVSGSTQAIAVIADADTGVDGRESKDKDWYMYMY
jgi:hypothetical protein